MTSPAAPERSRAATVAVVATVIGGAAYAWVAGHFTTFTRPAEVATFVPGFVGLAYAVRARSRHPIRADRSGRGWLAWWVIVIGINTLEVVTLALGATHRHPTMSDLVNPLLLSTPSRAVAFGLWLSFGYWLSRR